MIILVYTDISGHLQYYATPPKKTFSVDLLLACLLGVEITPKRELMVIVISQKFLLLDRKSPEKISSCICWISNVFSLKPSWCQVWGSEWVFSSRGKWLREWIRNMLNHAGKDHGKSVFRVLLNSDHFTWSKTQELGPESAWESLPWGEAVGRWVACFVFLPGTLQEVSWLPCPFPGLPPRDFHQPLRPGEADVTVALSTAELGWRAKTC